MAETNLAGPDRRGVVFITRLRTPNKGNEALSEEWLRLLRSRVPGEALRLAPRVPDHLLQFKIGGLGSLDEAASVFRGWVERTITQWAAAPPPPANSISAHVVLEEKPHIAEGALQGLKQRLNLRSRLAHLGVFATDYNARLSGFAAAGCVILNPAGEFWHSADDIPLRHLFDIYVAKQIGCRTAIVNHTFELYEPRLLEVTKLVYSEMDLIAVREEQSKARLTGLGLDADRIIVAPDLAFMTEPAPPSAQPDSRRPRVAFCPNQVMPNVVERSAELIRLLLDDGIDVVLVSNDFPYDAPALEELSRRFVIDQAGAGLGYRDYAALLGTFDAVISSRLHTGVLALTAGTPLVPVEGLRFKITAAMASAGVPISAVQPGTSQWAENAMAAVRGVLGNPGAAKAWTRAVVDKQRADALAFFDRACVQLQLDGKQETEDACPRPAGESSG